MNVMMSCIYGKARQEVLTEICRGTFHLLYCRSQEGSQFCKGFGGIGGVLRWRVDFAEMDESNYEDTEDWGEGF